jgi:hypothetical protein
MDNSALVRWELKDRSAAQERMAGQRQSARQIDQHVREMAAAQQRMAEEVRLDAALDASKPSVGSLQLVLPVLIGVACVFVWLLAQ